MNNSWELVEFPTLVYLRWKMQRKKKNKTKHLTIRVHPLFLTLREGMDKTAGTRFLYLTR